jgi:hypothetical protein
MTSASEEKWQTFNCFFILVGLRTYQHPCNFGAISRSALSHSLSKYFALSVMMNTYFRLCSGLKRFMLEGDFFFFCLKWRLQVFSFHSNTSFIFVILIIYNISGYLHAFSFQMSRQEALNMLNIFPLQERYYRDADKSFAPPGRKQATATKI